MSSMVTRPGNGATSAPPAPRRRDPFALLREMLSVDPFVGETWPALPGFFGAGTGEMFTPSFDVKETPTEYVFTSDLPGVEQKDLDVSVRGNRLTISGKREAEAKKEDEKVYSYERTFGSFTRSFTLPEGTSPDGIKADLKNGVLTVTLPKNPEEKPKKIDVQTS